MLISYNILDTHDPQERWVVRLKVLAWFACCYDTLTSARVPQE